MTANAVTSEHVEVPERSKPAPTRPDYRPWLGVLITAGSLAAALWGIDIPATAAALNRIDFRFLLLALLSVILTSAAKAARWRNLLAARHMPSYRRSFAVLNIGLLLNSFTPARLGDLARVLFLGQSEGESRSFLLGTIVTEKVSDLCGLLIGTLVLLFFQPFPGWFTGPVRGMLLLALLLTGALILLAWHAGFLVRFIKQLDLHPLFHWLLRDMTRALQQLREPKQPAMFLRLAFWTLIMPVLGASTNLLVFYALGLRLSFWAALFLLIVLMLGISAPSTPGRFGVFHYLTILALSQFGVDKAASLACGIILHLIVLLPTVIVGGVYLWRERASFHQLAASLTILKAKLQEETASK